MDVSLFVSMFASVALLFSREGAADREKARERRMREHRMNARLLRMDI